MERLGVLMSKPVLSIAAASHVLVVTETDGVWGWGNAQCGQMGVEVRDPLVATPIFLKDFTSRNIIRVFAGEGRSAGTTSWGSLDVRRTNPRPHRPDSLHRRTAESDHLHPRPPHRLLRDEGRLRAPARGDSCTIREGGETVHVGEEQPPPAGTLREGRHGELASSHIGIPLQHRGFQCGRELLRRDLGR